MFEKKVLIIDDEVDICFLIAAILKKQNFFSACAYSISTGMEKIKEIKPDILFLDINLPDGSGLDIIHSIKASSPNIYIIVISAYDNERMHAYEKGADFFISKPLNSHVITKSLEDLQLLSV